jgi:hypothetical protein
MWDHRTESGNTQTLRKPNLAAIGTISRMMQELVFEEQAERTRTVGLTYEMSAKMAVMNRAA